MDIKIRYRFDGGQTCQPIGAGVDSIATPVQIPIATDATIRVEIVSAWSRRIVRPNVDISGATAWRFAIFNSYGDGAGMLFATRNVDHAGAGWAFSWRDSGTKELYNALGTEPARVFRAELQGYASQTSALPVAVFSFPVRIGNRRGDIVAISPIEQFEEIDPVAMAALGTHEARRDNPHGVTAAQVGADAAGAAVATVAAHDADLAAHADLRSAVADAEGVAAAAQSSVSGVAAYLAAHEAARSNPHGVTEAQVLAASSTRVFGALELDNVWTGGNLSGVADVTTRIKAADDEGGGLSLASVYHVTAADSGDGPAAYLSGIAKDIPSGTASNVLLVFENDSSEERTHTLFLDVWRVFSRGIVSEGSPYLPATQLSAGAFALIPLTLWKLKDGRVAAIINDFIRTDFKDVYRLMTSKIFDGSGNVWALVADGVGGMHTEPIS